MGGREERREAGGRERERESETSIFCSTYVYIHWLILTRALTRVQTSNLGVHGQCSNQLSSQARTQKWTFLNDKGQGVKTRQ